MTLRREIAFATLLLLGAGPAAGQISSRPLPPPPAAPGSDAATSPLPFPASPPGAPTAPPETPRESAQGAQPTPEIGRVFCDQQITFHIAREDAVAPPYREFLGIWSDASWTPQLCAALIVEGVQPDGIASIIYAYGPMNSSARSQGGVLRGTGIIRDGELKFQNNDGSQFSFKPYFADLDGHLTTPKGQTYQAIFKKTY
jgi:hypothetical protein